MKKFFLGFIALFVSLTVFGAPRTAEEAAIIAAQFTNQQPAFRHLHRAALTANDLRLAHQTNKPSSNEAALYVFNKANDGGFVMVSADDNAVAILGYSDEGSFEVENINPNLQFWLGYYAERIANAQPVAHKNRAIRKAIQATTVSPLLGNIKWNQGTPYYNMCPMDPVDNTRSYTGCVATAAAQIMKYYNWPTTGEGTKTYTWTNDHGGSGTETVNFGATTYDWANMLDTYTSSANATQKNAVALLMYHVGVSCEMEYGGETTNGSGSQTSKMRTGLVNYFRYKSTATYGNGKTHAQLATIFTTELQNGRPILMGGDDGGQFGHEFVCDGLDEDGLFHINWGWGGNSNGYFALTGLDPDQEGIGGANSGNGYSKNIDYVIGIEPDSNPVAVTGVSVDPTTATIKMKERLQLTATVAPSNASNKGLSWSTSDASVATVNASGVVVGVSAGTATITATTNNGNKTASCTVTVTDEVAAAYELVVDYGFAEYSSDDQEWTLVIYDSSTEVPWIQFYFDSNSANKIAGTYDLAGSAAALWNDTEDPNANVATTAGQLNVQCVGKDNGSNGCNTYLITATFTCNDGMEYALNTTLEICGQDDDQNAIDLADNIGDGAPIVVTWMANGEEFASNFALDNKLTLPTDKPANCESGKVFVGWCADENYSGDEAPTFAKNNDVISANATFYAVYATAEGGGSATITLNATSDKTFPKDGITLSTTGGALDNGTDYRIYKGQTLTITSTVGNITSIAFTFSGSYNGGGWETTYEPNADSWTSPACTTGDNGKQARITKIVINVSSVTYSDYSTTCDGADPTPVYYDIRFFNNGTQVGETQSVLKGQQPIVPEVTPACDGYTFAGWWTAELAANNTEAKAWVTNFKASKNQDYYAIYSKTTTGTAAAVFDGNTSGDFKFYGQKGDTKYYAKASVNSNNKVESTTNESEAATFTFTKVDGGFTIKTNANKYIAYAGNSTNVALSDDAYVWVISASSLGYGSWRAIASTANTRALALTVTANYQSFGAYATSNTSFGSQYFDLEIGGGAPASTTYYSSILNCDATAIENNVVAPKAIKRIENGQIVIILGNEKYTIFGQKIQ